MLCTKKAFISSNVVGLGASKDEKYQEVEK